MKHSYKNQWKVMQKQGKKRYVWFNFVFVVGICVPAVDKIIKLIRGNFKSIQDLIIDLLLQIVIYSAIAYFMGRSSWSYIEKEIIIQERKEKLRNVNINFCYFCGSELYESTNQCPVCGEKLDI